jgi:hypothetical protein
VPSRSHQRRSRRQNAAQGTLPPLTLAVHQPTRGSLPLQHPERKNETYPEVVLFGVKNRPFFARIRKRRERTRFSLLHAERPTPARSGAAHRGDPNQRSAPVADRFAETTTLCADRTHSDPQISHCMSLVRCVVPPICGQRDASSSCNAQSTNSLPRQPRSLLWLSQPGRGFPGLPGP